MRLLKRLHLTFFCLLFIAHSSFSADSTAIKEPHVEGTIRAKYEYFTELDEHRFQVRNARIAFKGNIGKITTYKAEIDLSDEGKTKMLDAYVRLNPVRNFEFTMGQQKVPFSTDNLRSPYELYFANRSFIGKQLTNLRDVGMSVKLTNDRFLPLDFIAGIYNGMGLYTQDKTLSLNELSYAGRLVFFPKNAFRISLNANTIQPEMIRMTFYNVGLWYDMGNLHLETEYLYKTYSNNTVFDNRETTGFFVFGAYNIATPCFKTIKKITPVLRFDKMTKNLRYDVQTSANITTKTDEARHRITGGLNISLAQPFQNDIRLNYERYFWEDGSFTDSKIVAEFVVHF